MITKEDIRLDFIPEEGELCYVSDFLDTLVKYANERNGNINFMKNKHSYETINGTEWEYAYPVNGYKDEKTNGEFKPKRGDIVEVSDNKEHWVQRIFLAEIEGATYPFVVVQESYKDEFKNCEKFSHNHYSHMRKPVQKTKFTKAEISEKLNIPFEELEIID